jgi:hypothetical protein
LYGDQMMVWNVLGKKAGRKAQKMRKVDNGERVVDWWGGMGGDLEVDAWRC